MPINFKYDVGLKSLIGASDHKIQVFTETDSYDEFMYAVSNAASQNWEITSYNISWEEAF